MRVGIVVATLALLIIIVTFLLLFTKHNKKPILEQKLSSISRSVIQKIFYSDSRSESILNGEEPLKNILENKLDIKISQVEDSVFIEEVKRRLGEYNKKKYILQTSDTWEVIKHFLDQYTIRHLNYVSKSLNIESKTDCLNKYYRRIILAAALDSIFINHLNITAPEATIHEIISQLHKEGYEELGYKILNSILNNKKTYNIILRNKTITLNPLDYTININVTNRILLFPINNPSDRGYINTLLSFDICKKSDTRILNRNKFFNLQVPYNIKQYITKLPDENIKSYVPTPDPDQSILNFLEHRPDENMLMLNYVMPNSQSSPLSNISVEQLTSSTKHNSK